jgi:two-component system, cell cycle sensor histidine kinase and response regulator CckA
MEQTPGLQKAQKTILVVDDNATILRFVSKLLVDCNYNVLTAASGKEALQQSRDYECEIHLLLSDFEMPGMSGIGLATEISLERPQIKVLLMSGFTGGMLVLNEGWHFLAKPFIPSQLRALISGLISPDKHSKSKL